MKSPESDVKNGVPCVDMDNKKETIVEKVETIVKKITKKK